MLLALLEEEVCSVVGGGGVLHAVFGGGGLALAEAACVGAVGRGSRLAIFG